MVNGKSITYTYVTLYTASRNLKLMYDKAFESGRKHEALSLRLAALNMIFYTLEAFLNHLIKSIKPDIWKNEREIFSRGDVDGRIYRGPIGKLEYIHDCCNLKYDQERQTIKNIKLIKKYRDMIAHGKTYSDNYSQEECENNSSVFYIAKHELLVDSYNDIGILINDLFGYAKNNYNEVDLGPDPSLSISYESTFDYIQ